MKQALFGYTGFIGTNLDSQINFSHKYNSRNASDSFGLEFDKVFFAAARAEKWKINQNPSEDKQHLEELKSILSEIKTEQIILISTVDVFKEPVGVDETSKIDYTNLHSYGLHRAELEEFVTNTFEKSLIVRLPGLFGPGLKKNIIFDLMNQNNVDSINPYGSLQYYEVPLLGRDIEKGLENNLSIIHLTSEPLSTQTIAENIFGVSLNTENWDKDTAPKYDMRTIYSSIYGKTGNYTYSAESQLKAISRFASSEACSP